MAGTCVACGEERHRGPCSDPIPLDDDDLSRAINQDEGECEVCGNPLNDDEAGSSVCLDCYNDRRMVAGNGEDVDTSEVDQEECGYCSTGTDPEVICADCWANMEGESL